MSFPFLGKILVDSQEHPAGAVDCPAVATGLVPRAIGAILGRAATVRDTRVALWETHEAFALLRREAADAGVAMDNVGGVGDSGLVVASDGADDGPGAAMAWVKDESTALNLGVRQLLGCASEGGVDKVVPGSTGGDERVIGGELKVVDA